MCRPLPLQPCPSSFLKDECYSYRTVGIFLGGSEVVTSVCYIPRSMDGTAPVTEEAAGLGDPERLPEVAF
jgi:hypothetical protein